MSQNAKTDNLKRYHDALYNNINYLTFFYPPSVSMKAVFNKSMFFKNNKTAFQEITYYLLVILEPKLFQKNKIFWPLIDNKTEIEFRKLVSKFLNELNVTYPEANVPKATTSHLISPGGYKFTMLIFKVSKLVLEEHLKRNVNVKESILGPLFHDETLNTSSSIDLLHSVASKNFVEVKKLKEDLIKERNDARIVGREMWKQKSKLEFTLLIKDEELRNLESKAKTLPSIDTEKLNKLENRVKSLENLEETIANCVKLRDCLINNETLLEYKKNMEENTENLKEDSLNLYNLYEDIQKFLTHHKLNTQIVTEKEMQDYITLFENSTKQYQIFQDYAKQITDKLTKLRTELTEKTTKGLHTEKNSLLDVSQEFVDFE